jgi:hypothetical protein
MMDGEENNLLSCPFCAFSDFDGDFLSQHVEHCHPEDETLPGNGQNARNRTSFYGNDSETVSVEQLYVDCPQGCGESVPTSEVQVHLDLHAAEDMVLDESGAFNTRNDHEVRLVAGLHDWTDHDMNLSSVDQTDLAHHRDIVVGGKPPKGTRKNDGIKSGTGIRRLGVLVHPRSPILVDGAADMSHSVQN